MKNKLSGIIIKVVIGIIVTIIGGFLPYIIVGTSIDSNNGVNDFICKLAINEYANELIKDYKVMAITDEDIEYISSKEFKNELISSIEYELKFGDDYTVAYGLEYGLQKVITKLGIICSVVTLIIYLFFIKKI